MKHEQADQNDPRVAQALAELEQTIRERYPNARFAVSYGADEPENVHLLTTVDLVDPDEVVDLVLDRLVDLQVEEGIPVYVIPVRTPERILADEAGHGQSEHQHLRLVQDLVSQPNSHL